MKFVITILLIGMLIASPAIAGQRYGHSNNNHVSFSLFESGGLVIDDINIEIDDGDIILRHIDTDEEVIFTERYELIVNDRKIKTTPDQQEVIEEFYDTFFVVVDKVTEIGYKGAAIGWEGAKLGLKAIAKVFKLLHPEYDTDDLENEMEKEAEKIEERAEEIEEMAEKVENLVDHLEDLFFELEDSIPEIASLDW